ncbi:MAG: ATPase domain-containing protein [Haloferacaceae archaeon]
MTVPERERVSTGIAGLDEVVQGGLIAGRSYLFRGPAGAGKTLFGFHFLQAGVDAGESALFVNLEESIEDLRADAASLGIDVDAIEFLDLSPGAEVFTEDRSYEVFSAAEVEQEPLAEAVTERVREVDPARVVIDPITQLHYLTTDDYQFRKQVVGLMRFLEGTGATVAFTAQETADLPAEDLQFISDGTVFLDRGPTGRRVSVPKFRGSNTRSGDHAFRITDDGVVVYPELDPTVHGRSFEREAVPSGVPELDSLLNGGFERGTVNIISGPTGVGKTTLGTQFMKEAAGRGERSVIFLFEESERTFMQRSTAINIPVDRMVERGTLQVREVEALDLSPQEFAAMVREEVEEEGASIVMVDGISGYRLTLRGAEESTIQRLHALGRYLKRMGVTTLFIDETADVVGDFHATQENVSYLADGIVFLRHLELQGELRRAIGVLKKRTSDYERTLREFEITGHGISVGDPLTGLRGILGGTPEFVDDEN